MDIKPQWEGERPGGVYFDPVDEPTPGNAILVTFAHDRRLRFYGLSVEDCLRSLMTTLGHDEEEILFRRVAESGLTEIHVWDVAVPAGTIRNRANAPRRLLGCYRRIWSSRWAMTTSPEIAERYGILTVYIRSDESGGNCNYLDRTGMIRPLGVNLPADAIDMLDHDEAYAREEIEMAIVEWMEPIFPYSPHSR